ncbi:MAG TPA: hypothetical protein VFD30_20050, partial [Terriglobia bacterium]|nr:hypothetical protein [Terriglobia bacterium]
QARAAAAHPLVVIVKDKVPFQRGNGPSYSAHPDLPILNQGMEAQCLHQRGDWLQIQFATGEIGWVPRDQVLIDE